MKSTLSIALTLFVVTFTSAYPSGAPGAACPGLLPLHHGTQPQQSSSPYQIGVSSVQYSPNTPITVTIQSTDGSPNFMAFLLQARIKGTNTSAGQFMSPPTTTKLLRCFSSGDSITHAGATPRSQLQLTWMPPTSDVGEIEIRGTVAQSKLVYWGVLSSGPLSFGTSGTVTSSSASVPQSPSEGGTGTATSSVPVITTIVSSMVVLGATLLR